LLSDVGPCSSITPISFGGITDPAVEHLVSNDNSLARDCNRFSTELSRVPWSASDPMEPIARRLVDDRPVQHTLSLYRPVEPGSSQLHAGHLYTECGDNIRLVPRSTPLFRLHQGCCLHPSWQCRLGCAPRKRDRRSTADRPSRSWPRLGFHPFGFVIWARLRVLKASRASAWDEANRFCRCQLGSWWNRARLGQPIPRRHSARLTAATDSL
jgi:hypothetical protein